MTDLRALFVTWTGAGHLFPMVPLAWALRTAGWDVRVCVPPASSQAVVRTGLPAVVVGHDVDVSKTVDLEEFAAWRQRRWPEGWPVHHDVLDSDQALGLRSAAGRQKIIADAMLDDVVEFGRWWQPDVVVHDPFAFAGPVVAAALGVPAFAHGWELATILGLSDLLDDFAAMFDRYGATAPDGAQRLIDITPPSMRISGGAASAIDMRFGAYNGAGEQPRWPADRTVHRVCVTTGLALNRFYRDKTDTFFEDVLAVLGKIGVDIIIAAGKAQAQQIDELPARARVISAPFNLLLPTCDLVVHHGGAGTGLTAVASGVPQLVVPQSPIHTEVGRRVAASGAGVCLEVDRAGRDELLTTMSAMLSDDRRGIRLEHLGAELSAMPAPARVAERITHDLVN